MSKNQLVLQNLNDLLNKKRIDQDIYGNATIIQLSGQSLSSSDVDSDSSKKKPKPLPKPFNRQPSDTHPYINQVILSNNTNDPIYVNNETHMDVYENVPDEIKVQLSRCDTNNKYVSMDPVPIAGISNDTIDDYEEFNVKRRSSNEYIMVDKTRESSEVNSSTSYYHHRGDLGCIYQASKEYYTHYTLNLMNVRNHAYPFEEKQKFERLPCFCHEDKKRKFVRSNQSDLFYSCEGLHQANGTNDDSVKIKKASLDADSLKDMTFEPFDKNNPLNKSNSKVKSVIKKKFSQLTTLLSDWST